MNQPIDKENWESRREQAIGPGEHAARDPELQQRIQELEATKATLAAANRQLQAVLDAASEFSIIATDPDGLITIFNRGAEKMLGYTAEEMVGKQTPLAMHLAEEIDARGSELSSELGRLVSGFRVFVEQARDTGAEKHEWTYLRKDGSRLLVSLTVTVMRDEQGDVTGFLGIAKDITERKQAENELRQKEELFHLLFEKSGDANLLIDDTAFIDCNEATLRMLGCSDKQQIIATHPADISPEYQPDGRLSAEKANEMMLHAYQQGSHRFEWTHRRMDGTSLSVEVMLTAIPMHGRWILHTAWRDLTERKKAEEEQERLSQSLLHAQKIESIGRLAGGVAHDFNNLLTPIMVYAEMLRTSCGRDERTTKKIDGIISASGKARDLTRQLLAFSRKQVLEMKVVDLNRTLEAFMPILERTIREDIHLTLKLMPDLGSILADRPQIEQIIMNLAINAQDAMPSGGTLLIETSNVMLRESPKNHFELPCGTHVKLSVSDTGCGMCSETREHIFEPFFTTKEQGKGTGLGLATVFGIVKQHRGHINVYSEPGHGSTFTVFFPRLDEGAEASDTIEDVSHAALHQGVTILLVEDNAMVRELTCELLTDHGYSVLTAEGPEQAVSMMETNRDGVDLLLSDVIMPGMSGPALFELLEKLKPELKVIFMSGYNEDLIAQQYMLGDSPHYIQKPFSSHDLLHKIDEVLRQQQSHPETVPKGAT